MILKMRFYGDPVLRTKADTVPLINEEIKKIANDLIDTLFDERGLGLAAPQVGISKRIIAVDTKEEGGNPLVLVNPEIMETAGSAVMEEGCLSFPEIYGKIERPSEVTVKGMTLEGKECKLSFKGMPARVFLHEIDHLEGILFIDRMSPAHKIVIKSKLKKLMKATKESLGLK